MHVTLAPARRNVDGRACAREVLGNMSNAHPDLLDARAILSPIPPEAARHSVGDKASAGSDTGTNDSLTAKFMSLSSVASFKYTVGPRGGIQDHAAEVAAAASRKAAAFRLTLPRPRPGLQVSTDGWSCSSRLQKSMLLGSVVLKESSPWCVKSGPAPGCS